MGQDERGLERRRLLTTGAAVITGAGLAAAVPERAAAAGRPGTRTVVHPAVAVTPGDQRYPDLVRGWNQRYIGTPDTVYLVRHTDQVAQIVQQAVTAGKRITVRSGGHCWEDFVHHPDIKVIVDMSEMNKVDYDPALNAFSVEAGAQILDIYEQLYLRWGVTIPAGTCFQVGAGGHVSGGGWGLLLRKHGLVIDHLYAVEVVTVDATGTVRTVMATREATDPHRDLWWAHTGGGGGSFGIVTRYWFRSPGATGTAPAAQLPKPPAEVLISAVSWPWAGMTEAGFKRLAQNFAEWSVAHSGANDPNSALCASLSLSHKSNGQIGLFTQVDATVPNAAQLLSDFIAAIGAGVGTQPGAATTRMGEYSAMPEMASPRTMPWMQATRYIGLANATGNDPTLKGDFKSSYMRSAFPASQLTALYHHLTRTDLGNPTGGVSLTSHGGKVNTVPAAATASAHRDSAFKLAWMIWWSDPAEEAGCVRWVREFYADVYSATGGVPVPNAVTDGCYINYPDVDLSSPLHNTSQVPWHELYFKGNYPRLQTVKAAYDPLNVFRHAQSVRLPGT
ncbi:FAD-binding oxidoreductase [Streptomyces sp. NPDC001985]|uniref:FAD-binding oxidoreductase n=1 Tax=Streptomyces sp. NPDC001985 TaxID=3154406 RepID=UPI0033197D11